MRTDVTGNTASALGDDIESVTLFTKFDNGFYSASSDGLDRSKAVATYHLSSRGGLKWLFDVSLYPKKARYTFAKYGDVRTAALASGGREGGVVGVRFSLLNRQILDVHRFARLFADAFDASCEKAPAFPFKRVEGFTYPAASNFANVDFDLLHKWIAVCLIESAVKFVVLPSTSYSGDIHEVQSTAAPLETGDMLSTHSGVRIVHRENAAPAPDKPRLAGSKATPTIGTPSPDPIGVPTPAIPVIPVNSTSMEPTKGWYFGRNAWVPGAIIGTLVGGAGFAMSVLQQSKVDTQLATLSQAISGFERNLTNMNNKLTLSAVPVTAPTPSSDLSKPTNVGGTQEKKPGGSDGSQAAGAKQINKLDSEAADKQNEKDSRKTGKTETDRRDAEKIAKASATKIVNDEAKEKKAGKAVATPTGRPASGERPAPQVGASSGLVPSGAGPTADSKASPATDVIPNQPTQAPISQPAPAGPQSGTVLIESGVQ
jgi:hypothetical protein